MDFTDNEDDDINLQVSCQCLLSLTKNMFLTSQLIIPKLDLFFSSYFAYILSLQMNWSSEPAGGSKLAYEMNLRNHQSSMQV